MIAAQNISELCKSIDCDSNIFVAVDIVYNNKQNIQVNMNPTWGFVIFHDGTKNYFHDSSIEAELPKYLLSNYQIHKIKVKTPTLSINEKYPDLPPINFTQKQYKRMF